MLKPVLILNGITTEDFLDQLENRLVQTIGAKIASIHSARQDLDFVSDFKARCIISGDTNKPISKKTFNRLRAEGKITTYYPSEGRTSYRVSELNAYLESTNHKSSIK